MRLQDTSRRPLVPKFAPADDYTAFCDAVRRLCGVDLEQYKRGQMERRIRTWTARRGTTDLAAYATQLRAEPEELDAFLDRVTINVSQLWRHPEPWKALEDAILPELAAAGGRVRAWSAGCSYGAEADTLAAVCRMAIRSARVEIKGADLDRRMVARAPARAASRARTPRARRATPSPGSSPTATCRSSTSRSSASRSSLTTPRRSTRSSASRTRSRA